MPLSVQLHEISPLLLFLYAHFSQDIKGALIPISKTKYAIKIMGF